MTDKERASLDKRIEQLQTKEYKKKREYDDLLDQLSDLLDQRYPERQERVLGEIRSYSI